MRLKIIFYAFPPLPPPQNTHPHFYRVVLKLRYHFICQPFALEPFKCKTGRLFKLFIVCINYCPVTFKLIAAFHLGCNVVVTYVLNAPTIKPLNISLS